MNHETTRNNTKQSTRNIVISFVLLRVVSWSNFCALQAGTFRSDTVLRCRPRAFVILATCLLLLCAARVSAQQQTSKGLDAPVERGAKATDLDLIRLVLPDVKETDAGDAVATKTIEARDLLADEETDSTHYEGQIKLADYTKLKLHNGAHDDWFFLLNLTSVEGADNPFTWGETHIVALFRLAPQPRLLDAVEAQADRFVELWDARSVIAIGPRKQALILASSHFNAGESFLQLALISAERDKLKAVFTEGDVVVANACGYNFEIAPDITSIKQGRGDHYPLRLRVKLQLKPEDVTCQHRRRRAVTRYYQAPLIWQTRGRRYVVRGHGMDWLDKFEKAYINQP